MPYHSGKKKKKKNGKKKKGGMKKRKGLTAKQKKLPMALQRAILKKQRGRKWPLEEDEKVLVKSVIYLLTQNCMQE